MSAHYVQPNYRNALVDLQQTFIRKAELVHTKTWQGVDISKKPEMATFELLHPTLRVSMNGYDNAEHAARDILPNMPWAEDHFLERVCGQPINPGVQWAKWPYGQSAAKFLDADGKFNHNYMERYWPKNAGAGKATETADQYPKSYEDQRPDTLRGIKYDYGDLGDVIKQLADDPYTRQAYLPIWFPEDTGGGMKRAPCTLGYHFIMRDDRLDITYYIRSCDMKRHMRDDIYLTHRLAEWVLQQVQQVGGETVALWDQVELGTFTMHMTSLHVFRNDWNEMFPNETPPNLR